MTMPGKVLGRLLQNSGVCGTQKTGETGETGERIPRINIPNSGSEFEKEVTNFEKSIYAAVEMDERRGSAGVEAIRWARTWRWSEATEKAVDTYREVIC